MAGRQEDYGQRGELQSVGFAPRSPQEADRWR